MIIFGTQPRSSLTSMGEFHCPSCDTKRRFKRVRVRRMFSLFFVPIFPVTDASEYVECEACGDTFNPAILRQQADEDREKFEAEYRRAIRRVIVQMMLADGTLMDEAEPFIQSTYSDLCGVQLPRGAIAATIAEVSTDGVCLFDSLKALASTLNEQGKESVMKAAFAIATSDLRVAASEIDLMREIGAGLQMTEVSVERLIQSLLRKVGATSRA